MAPTGASKFFSNTLTASATTQRYIASHLGHLVLKVDLRNIVCSSSPGSCWVVWTFGYLISSCLGVTALERELKYLESNQRLVLFVSV